MTLNQLTKSNYLNIKNKLNANKAKTENKLPKKLITVTMNDMI